FLYYWLQKNEAFLSALGSGSTVMGLSLIDLRSIEVVIPEKKEQSRIGKILSDIDVEIGSLQAKLIKYKQIKQGMMQTLLTGRVRLI
ncbi:MAG: restriction endonuclease subunit S, partial [Candidatus Moranbacteria bacterium]|nr:restriction endonuclease subunit S [Candidatus Moranbacteria bacterium]